jgi:hypothetical protein
MAATLQPEVHAVEEKLQQFGKTLPDQERRVLDWLVERSRAATMTASGETLEGAVASQDLAASLGFSEEAPTLVVGWSRAIF